IQLLLDAPGGARIVGATGSNGKSTTTALIGHVLEKAGLPVEVGGNLGPPTLGLDTLDANGVYVLELSSYQLELTPRPRFDIGIFLNLEPDHLDRHAGLHGYATQKRRIFDGEGVAVVGVDDPHGIWLADRLQSLRHVVPISADDDLGSLTLSPALTGRHNRQNAAAAIRTAEALGLSARDIGPGLADFAGLPHRQELTVTMGQVRYINDSKATNAAAATRALDSFDRIHWIAGGLAKDGGLKGIEPWIDRLLGVYLIGDSEQAFAEQLAMMAPGLDVVRAGNLQTALAEAHTAAQTDNRPSVVLLSPACASFDQYQSYEARGDAFRDAVHQLPLPQPQGAAA
ncbi:MAG: UDP-N-acetylmuramoyl-L-alanine--D-glutamate ligase, partial [Alphaproteobacteria bacterium]